MRRSAQTGHCELAIVPCILRPGGNDLRLIDIQTRAEGFVEFLELALSRQNIRKPHLFGRIGRTNACELNRAIKDCQLNLIRNAPARIRQTRGIPLNFNALITAYP